MKQGLGRPVPLAGAADVAGITRGAHDERMVARVVPHDPAWQDAFRSEAAVVRAALGGALTGLHHIGSTAIPGILAKPILDLLAEVPTLEAVDAKTPALEGLGYEPMGPYGIEGRRYFRKTEAAGRRTHHLHVFEVGAPHVERHLAFRDYLRAHDDVAAAYSSLKARLTRGEDPSPGSYADGKDPFLRAVERDALDWYRQRRGR